MVNSFFRVKKYSASRLVRIAGFVLVGMVALESLKQLIFPAITIWQSHLVTIAFSTLVSVLAAYYVSRKADLLIDRISKENMIRQQSESGLRLSEEKFSKLFHANPDWVIISKLYDGTYIDVNEAFLRMTGYSRNEVIGHTSNELHIWVDPKERQDMIPLLVRDGRLSNHEVRYRMKSGEIRYMLRSAELIYLDGQPCLISVCKDITELTTAAEEREKLIAQLEDSLSKVKLPSGMLPICASCKKIRDDKGYWNQIELYIKEHSDADFTHGLCPDCAGRLYPKFYKKEN